MENINEIAHIIWSMTQQTAIAETSEMHAQECFDMAVDNLEKIKSYEQEIKDKYPFLHDMVEANLRGLSRVTEKLCAAEKVN